MSDFDDDDLDLDLEIDEGPKEIAVFDPTGEGALDALLASANVRTRTLKLGSELMNAAKDGLVAGIVISAHADPELRGLFMRMHVGRFGHIPVVYASGQAHDPAAVTELKGEGASAIVPWPLDGVQPILSAFGAVLDLQEVTEGGIAPVAPPAAPVTAESEQDVLRRKVQALEHAAAPAPDPEAERYEAENTSLRSEVTVMKERNSMLEHRLKRMTDELQAVNQERERLLTEAPPEDQDETTGLTELRQVASGLDAYLWGFEQAIQYFEELKLTIGEKRAPTLAAHLKNFEKVKVYLDHVRKRTRNLAD